ncbi:hydroxypyruvate isomerase family protein [Pseudonocardia alaniniphila]|uniref:TIM barrel protein n=1 Tax=Pseudonocardia alaniniphila TaxID=75291 RepID=A0ABS9T7T4_9PSEU|nr:TIM barrel protein [Pseudonocardia alaniniphila]MCH6164582.1 TIM barrel protein [Pseudonocardia alaniniphila]
MARYTVNCSILFTELPLLERPAAARAAGFDAVEFWWPFPTATPEDAEVERFVRAVEDAGVRLTGLNFAAGDMPAGDRGLVSCPGREAEFRASVDIAVGIGGRLGTGVFNALYGNRIAGTDPMKQDDVAVENLAYATGQVEGAVVVEPVSGVDRYPLRTAADAIAVADRVASPNLKLLADLYHLTVNGDDVAAAIERYAGRIGHVQIADAPGRHEPGTGEIPFDQHLAALDRAGYTGWIGLEYQPSTTSDRAFDWLPSAQRGATTQENT